MFKATVFASLAIGGLVLAGCSKDETPVPTTPATQPAATMSTTMPAAAAAAIDQGKAAMDQGKTMIEQGKDKIDQGKTEATNALNNVAGQAKSTTQPGADNK